MGDTGGDWLIMPFNISTGEEEVEEGFNFVCCLSGAGGIIFPLGRRHSLVNWDFLPV